MKTIEISAAKITSGIYLYNLSSNKFLICHATRSKGGWSIPKGIKEKDENIFQAAVRELFEETNINLNQIDVLKIYPLPGAKYEKRNKILESFLVISKIDEQSIELRCHSHVDDKFPEIDKYKWVDLEEFSGLIHKTQAKNIELIKRTLAMQKTAFV